MAASASSSSDAPLRRSYHCADQLSAPNISRRASFTSALQLARCVQRVQHRNPRCLVLALQFGQGRALAWRDRPRLVQHDRNEVAAGPEQYVEVVADQDSQPARGVGRGLLGALQHLLLPFDGRTHALFHHGVQQRALALEVIEGRAALHAHRRRDVARAGGVEALAPEQPGGRAQQLAAAVAVVPVLHGLARAPTRALRAIDRTGGG